MQYLGLTTKKKLFVVYLKLKATAVLHFYLLNLTPPPQGGEAAAI